MKIYFLTRFSIFDYDIKAFRINKILSLEDYKEELFSEARLNAKFNAFEKVTLPSIVRQTNKNYEWYIFTSSELPVKYKIKLIDLIKSYSQIKVLFVNSMREFFDYDFNFDNNYATVRLDDDDGLNENFVELMQQYADADKYKCIISFPNGHKYQIENDKIIVNKQKINKPYIACGLAAISMNIYRCGNHTKINEKYNVILDNTPNMYQLLCSEFCDTKFSAS